MQLPDEGETHRLQHLQLIRLHEQIHGISLPVVCHVKGNNVLHKPNEVVAGNVAFLLSTLVELLWEPMLTIASESASATPVHTPALRTIDGLCANAV